MTSHTILASADSEVFTSLLKRPSSRADRYAMGKALRKAVPRKKLSGWRNRRGSKSGSAHSRLA